MLSDGSFSGFVWRTTHVFPVLLSKSIDNCITGRLLCHKLSGRIVRRSLPGASLMIPDHKRGENMLTMPLF